MTVESFEALCMAGGYKILDRTLWLVSPHYKVKFNLTPRRLCNCIGRIPYLRNYFSTACFYIVSVWQATYAAAIISPPPQKIGLAVRSIGGMDIKNKDNPDELSRLVAGGGLEPPASGLWARRATNCSIPRYWIAKIQTLFYIANYFSLFCFR